MQITILGIIWLFFIICFFLANDFKSMLFLLFFSMIFQSTNILIYKGSLGIGPPIITSFSFIIFCVVTRRVKYFISPKNYTSIILLLFILYIFFSSLIRGFDYIQGVYLNFVALLIYSCTFFILDNNPIYINSINKNKIINFICFFSIIIGTIQLLIKAKILPDMSLFQALIYNDTINPNVIYNTKDVVQMYSTFMEPSYYGAFLVGLFYYYLSEWNGNKNIIYLVLIFISIIFTKSTTAYLGLFITFIFFIFSNSQKKSLRIILPLIIFFSLFLSIFYSKLLDQVIFNKFSSSSAKVRSNWNKSAFYAFKDNILFGTGFKNYRASSLLFSIIANLGLMGILMYLSLIYSIIKTKTKSVKKYNYVVKSKMMLFGVVISQFIACPDLDFCVFWFAMYSLALFQSKNRI